jgi:hypothetical protein
VIKCLGKEFCNISDFVPNDGTLSKKLASKKVAGPRAKQFKKDKGKNKKEDDDNTHKKARSSEEGISLYQDMPIYYHLFSDGSACNFGFLCLLFL